MKKQTYLLVPLLYLFLSSCFSDKCERRTISIEYSGFDSTELSIAVVNKFEPGSNFTRFVGTDTVTTLSASRKIVLSENHDWIISLPLASRTDVVNDIIYTDKVNRRSGPSGGSAYADCCYDAVTYKVNGKETAREMDWDESCSGFQERITIQK